MLRMAESLCRQGDHVNIKELGTSAEPAMENADKIRRGRGAKMQYPNFTDTRAHLGESSTVGTSSAIHGRASQF